MVRRMPRQMHHPPPQPPHPKHRIILPQQIKHPFILGPLHAIPLPKQTLHLPNPPPNTHRRRRHHTIIVPTLRRRQPPLQVEGRREVVGVSVGFEDVGDGVAAGVDEGEEGVGGGGGHGAGGGVVVQYRVDDGCCVGRWVGDEVLPGAGLRVEEAVDGGLWGFGGWGGGGGGGGGEDSHLESRLESQEDINGDKPDTTGSPDVKVDSAYRGSTYKSPSRGPDRSQGLVPAPADSRESRLRSSKRFS
ncbi:hypothetical protein CHGG_00278 [Chaetomium globosum CBS 148.51]|uniref:Uncharacterized protein n=1 Tax=Chaetomium globosum (strain ATCC 6205 / CBS 148.51 / DSM 1962 / NBRC 6347 / NRRL 1970) TaxID=306901 RepID=Q2HHM6_CHAGB|nr:uncharacterized protein CHGG_00278 [Chaetomium globosum CBS 148.51]EAQ92043.1 hypothetical protein CHGG_00278 [Chaetomium globosum CBS 148.51]